MTGTTCLSVFLSAAPIIVTPPGDVYNVSGSQVYLSCEAVGVPTPVLTWKKVSLPQQLISQSYNGRCNI